jgi:hypothetical protein
MCFQNFVRISGSHRGCYEIFHLLGDQRTTRRYLPEYSTLQIQVIYRQREIEWVILKI